MKILLTGILISTLANASDCESLVKDAAYSIDYKDAILALATLKENKTHQYPGCLPEYIISKLERVTGNTELPYQTSSVHEYKSMCSNELYKLTSEIVDPSNWIQLEPYKFSYNFKTCVITLSREGTQVKVLQ